MRKVRMCDLLGKDPIDLRSLEAKTEPTAVLYACHASTKLQFGISRLRSTCDVMDFVISTYEVGKVWADKSVPLTSRTC